MPSTPYAASAANTPIASARRPTKRRPHQSISSPVRQAELNPDTGREGKGGNSRSIGIKSGAPEVVVSVAEGGQVLLTPKSKNSERDIEEQQPESSLSPPKARKGSTSSTPRSSGIMDDRWGTTQVTGCTGGSVDVGLGGSDDKADVNRHKPKESTIFSPALRPEQHVASAPTDNGAPSEGEPEPGATLTPAALNVGDDDTQEHPQLGMEAKAAEPGNGVDVDTPIDTEEIKDGECEGGVEEGDDQSLDVEMRMVAEGEMEEGIEEQHQHEEEGEEDEFNPYCFIAHLPPYNTVKHYTPEAPALPQKRKTRHGKELTLVLDLDETLVHCTVDPINNPDHRFEVHFNGEEFQVYVRKRPHLDAFLEAVSELFEVVVFTASQQVYAERLLNMIDPQKKFVKYRLYRDACMTLEGNYLKDLNVLGRDLSKVAIVDNSPYAYGFQIDNGIPIESWFDDTSDEELLHLLPLLKQLIHESEAAGGDVRPFIRNIFKTHELVDKARNGMREFASPMNLPLPLSSTVSSSEGEDNSLEEEEPANEGHPMSKKQIVAAE